MKTRILFISPQPFFQWRGSPIRVKFNLMALSKLGYQIDLLTLPIGEDLEIENVRVHRVANPFGVRNIPIGPSLWKLFFDLLIFLKGVALCLQNRYGVIHGIEEAGLIAAILAKLCGAKVIFEKHSDPSSYKKGMLKNCLLKIYGAVERISVHLADAVIGTGPGLVDQVNAMGTGTQAYHISDIPSSLHTSSENEILETRAGLLRNPSEVLITFVGSFAVYQGIDLMFDAIPRVAQSTPQARFIIIGGNDEEIAWRRQQLSVLGAVDKVTFLGKIAPDLLPKYLAASDILLSPRISGINTPLKVLDYMKAGRPILATDLPSNRLLLSEATAEFAHPEPEAFARGIISLVSDEKKRRELGKACRAIYESTYTFDHHCQRLAGCYNTILHPLSP